MSEKYYHYTLNHDYKLRVEKNEKNMLFARVDIISPSGKAVKIYNDAGDNGDNGDNYAPRMIPIEEAYVKHHIGRFTLHDLIAPGHHNISHFLYGNKNVFLIQRESDTFCWATILVLDVGDGKCELGVEDFEMRGTDEEPDAPTGQPAEPVVKFLLRYERQNLVTKQYEQASHLFDSENEVEAFVHEHYLPSWKNMQLHDVVNTREVSVERVVKF